MPPRRPIKKTPRSTGIRRNRPTNRRAVFRRIGRIKLTRARRALQIPKQHARPANRKPGVDLQPPQPLQRNHPTRMRHAAARNARPGASDRQWRPRCRSLAQNLRHFRSDSGTNTRSAEPRYPEASVKYGESGFGSSQRHSQSLLQDRRTRRTSQRGYEGGPRASALPYPIDRVNSKEQNVPPAIASG